MQLNMREQKKTEADKIEPNDVPQPAGDSLAVNPPETLRLWSLLKSLCYLLFVHTPEQSPQSFWTPRSWRIRSSSASLKKAISSEPLPLA